MARNRSKNFKIDSNVPASADPINANKLLDAKDDKVAVNLRYFQSSHECFSAWQKAELKAFSSFVVKLSKRTKQEVTSTTKTCHAHKGATKPLPSGVSPEVKLYSLDVGSKVRVHGFFVQNGFFLVWLDREHKVLSL